MRTHRSLRGFVLITLATPLLCGCSAVGQLASALPTFDAGATATPHAPIPSAQTAVPIFDVCALMPLADVQAGSPFQTPITRLAPDYAPGTCGYTVDLKAPRSALISFHVDTAASVADAADTLAYLKQQAADLNNVADVPGLGDGAWSDVEQGDDITSVTAIQGFYMVSAGMQGEWDDGRSPQVTSAQKIAAAIAYCRLLFSRIH